MDCWCLAPLSVISWSKIWFGCLVFTATFSYFVVKETTDLTQSHWQTCVFQRLVNYYNCKGLDDIFWSYWYIILKTDHAYYAKKSWKIPEEQTTQWLHWQNIHIQTRWLHIKVQEVCNAAVEPHRDKQNKQRTSHYKRYAKPCASPTGIKRTNKRLRITRGMQSRVLAPQRQVEQRKG